MKRTKIIVGVICLILMMNFFYGGLYKIVNISSYKFWLANAPLVEHFPKVIQYIIIPGEMILPILFWVPSCRVFALNCTWFGMLLFVVYIFYFHIFTHYLVFPFYAFRDNQSWFIKIIFSLLLSWLAFIGIILNKRNSIGSKNIVNSLRNTHAKAS